MSGGPATSPAIGELRERLDRDGFVVARYLALPSTARWWLDHYEGLADHLQRVGRVLDRTPDCTLYEL